VVCMRIADGAVRQCKNGGYLHRVQPGAVHAVCIPVPRQNSRPKRQDLDELSAYYRRAARENPNVVCRLGTDLGLTAESLHRMQVGWSPRRQAFAFPMRDHRGTVVGIRLRRPDGSKYAVTGSRDGLFIPEALAGSERLIVTEGPTDTAALLQCGFQAVGRPSCSGGIRELLPWIRRQTPDAVVVVADDDEPGRRGARRLAASIALYAPSVRIVVPPAGMKDARAWINAGANAKTIEEAIHRAPVWAVRGRDRR
jgi:phage/plasmid primase-like uncharacterized protein